MYTYKNKWDDYDWDYDGWNRPRTRLCRRGKKDESYISTFKDWKEIDVREYTTTMDQSSEEFIQTKEKGHKLILRNKKTAEEKDEEKDSKIKRTFGPFWRESNIKQVIVEELDNIIAKTIMEHYQKDSDSAAKNELYLQEQDDRVFGFYILNMHTADIDINMGNKAKENHLMIRYNENTLQGWEKRMD